MTKQEIKKTAQAALKSEYGFAPALTDIRLLEDNGERTYIRFAVENKEYVFNSYKWADGSVWVGKGTIEKVN